MSHACTELFFMTWMSKNVNLGEMSTNDFMYVTSKMKLYICLLFVK